MVFRCRRGFATCDNKKLFRKFCHLIIRKANKSTLHYSTINTVLVILFFGVEKDSRHAAMKRLFSTVCHIIISEANRSIVHDSTTDYYLAIGVEKNSRLAD